MVLTGSTTTGRVLLKNISWQTYESLLKEIVDTRTNRLTYDRGLLEIMTPSMPHESWKRLIENPIVILAQELQLNLKSVGSVTCKREDLKKGKRCRTRLWILHSE